MEAWRAVTLPGGWWSGDALHRSAFVRPLTGRDQETLLAAADSTLPERASMLIARCVTRPGPSGHLTEDDADRLTVGDREALMLALRRATFGERLQCVLDCAECGEPMDLDLTVGALLVEPAASLAPTYDESIAAPDGCWRLRYRLPTGADQIAIARACASAPERATAVLLGRCVLAAEAPDGAAVHPAALPEPVADALGSRMAALDPQAEIALECACPACGARMSAVLDAADLLLREVAARGTDLYREVHALALHYHWSEREILDMPHGKRRRYLALLDETLGGAA